MGFSGRCKEAASPSPFWFWLLPVCVNDPFLMLPSASTGRASTSYGIEGPVFVEAFSCLYRRRFLGGPGVRFVMMIYRDRIQGVILF